MVIAVIIETSPVSSAIPISSAVAISKTAIAIAKPAPTIAASIVPGIKPWITPAKAPAIVTAIKWIIAPVVIRCIPVVIITRPVARAVKSP
jgi:hypothetical protein